MTDLGNLCMMHYTARFFLKSRIRIKVARYQEIDKAMGDTIRPLAELGAAIQVGRILRSSLPHRGYRTDVVVMPMQLPITSEESCGWQRIT